MWRNRNNTLPDIKGFSMVKTFIGLPSFGVRDIQADLQETPAFTWLTSPDKRVSKRNVMAEIEIVWDLMGANGSNAVQVKMGKWGPEGKVRKYEIEKEIKWTDNKEGRWGGIRKLSFRWERVSYEVGSARCWKRIGRWTKWEGPPLHWPGQFLLPFFKDYKNISKRIFRTEARLKWPLYSHTYDLRNRIVDLLELK